MPVSKSDAADTLRDIDQTQERSARLYGYRMASPHLIVWGVIWAIGYTASYARPQWQAVWPLLIVIGMVASFWFGSRAKPEAAVKFHWRYAATFAAIAVFISAVFAILPPVTGAQTGAFFPILVGFFYTLVGIWSRGARMLITGVALVALTLFGFFYLPQYFALWMAIVGGGGLVLGGIWLKAA